MSYDDRWLYCNMTDNSMQSSNDTLWSLEKVEERSEKTRSAAADDGCIRATFLKALAQCGCVVTPPFQRIDTT